MAFILNMHLFMLYKGFNLSPIISHPYRVSHIQLLKNAFIFISQTREGYHLLIQLPVRKRKHVSQKRATGHAKEAAKYQETTNAVSVLEFL